MGRLKGLSELKVWDRPPVKAQPTTDKDGGIFTSKIIAIMQKIREKWRNS